MHRALGRIPFRIVGGPMSGRCLPIRSEVVDNLSIEFITTPYVTRGDDGTDSEGAIQSAPHPLHPRRPSLGGNLLRNQSLFLNHMTATPRKVPEHQPWTIFSDLIPEITTEFDSLADCEKACKILALENPGMPFRPVKFGKPYLAQKVEKVVLQ